jgi:hypothetical protein
MSKEVDHLLEYFSLLQVMATAGKTHAAIIHCLGVLADGAEFRDNYHEQFLEGLKMAMVDSQETLKQLEKAEIRLNKRHSDVLSGTPPSSQSH